MKLTAELSLYPLNADYIPVIKAFIADCDGDPDLVVVSNAMSTQVCGDYERVFERISGALRRSSETHGRQVLVCKFIPGELAIAD